jgi:hypothetical protein
VCHKGIIEDLELHCRALRTRRPRAGEASSTTPGVAACPALANHLRLLVNVIATALAITLPPPGRVGRPGTIFSD